jgi:hypothetical protein
MGGAIVGISNIKYYKIHSKSQIQISKKFKYQKSNEDLCSIGYWDLLCCIGTIGSIGISNDLVGGD